MMMTSSHYRASSSAFGLSSFMLLLTTTLLTIPSSVVAQTITIALIPKQVNNPFFDTVRDGCVERAAQLNEDVTCEYTGPTSENAQEQAQIMDNLVAAGNVSGIAVSVIDPAVTGPAIDRAVAAGVHVVTYDSDAPESQRAAYIGSNNAALGHSFAWLLAVGGSQGGTYGVISDSAPNVAERAAGLQTKLAESFPNVDWTISGEPTDCQDDIDMALDQAEAFAAMSSINAIVSVGGWPMFSSNTTRWKSIVDSRPDVLFFVADTLPVQLQLIQQGYANALVGQQPKQMGVLSIDKLVALATGTQNATTPGEIIFTGEEIHVNLTKDDEKECPGDDDDDTSSATMRIMGQGSSLAIVAACFCAMTMIIL